MERIIGALKIAAVLLMFVFMGLFLYGPALAVAAGALALLKDLFGVLWDFVAFLVG